jgi:hypothetical protein
MLIRTYLLAGATLATLSGAPLASAFAQDVILLPEEEVVVREYVVRQPPRQQVVVPDGYSVVVGEPLPDTIEVTPIDAPGFTKEFEYVVLNGRTVLIDPDTREVVKVLD